MAKRKNPKKETDRKKLVRCLTIFRIMMSKRITTSALAIEFNCDQRSILRDLHALELAGFAISHRTAGTTHYWTMIGDYGSEKH